MNTTRLLAVSTALLATLGLNAASSGATTSPPTHVGVSLTLPPSASEAGTPFSAQYRVSPAPKPGVLEAIEVERFVRTAKHSGWVGFARRIRVARTGRGAIATKGLGIGKWLVRAVVFSSTTGKTIGKSSVLTVRAYKEISLSLVCKGATDGSSCADFSPSNAGPAPDGTYIPFNPLIEVQNPPMGPNSGETVITDP